jgi:hypothetical protein
MARVIIGWPDFWSTLKEMTPDCLAAVGREWHGEDFTKWVNSRSPRVQVEILENAPESIQQYFYSKNVIRPFAIAALGIRPSRKVIVSDRRK